MPTVLRNRITGEILAKSYSDSIPFDKLARKEGVIDAYVGERLSREEFLALLPIPTERVQQYMDFTTKRLVIATFKAVNQLRARAGYPELTPREFYELGSMEDQ